MMTLVVATHNAHKLTEISLTLGALIGPGIELVATDGPAPVEDGKSFVKRSAIRDSRHSRMIPESASMPWMALPVFSHRDTRTPERTPQTSHCCWRK